MLWTATPTGNYSVFAGLDLYSPFKTFKSSLYKRKKDIP